MSRKALNKFNELFIITRHVYFFTKQSTHAASCLWLGSGLKVIRVIDPKMRQRFCCFAVFVTKGRGGLGGRCREGVGIGLCFWYGGVCVRVCKLVLVFVCLSVSVCVGGSQGEADHKTTGGKQEGGRFQEMVCL